jgi:hypothetical protein
MSNDAKRTSQLGIATALSSTDRVVVLKTGATQNTQTITLPNLAKSLANTIPGPYASDSAANSAGVALKTFYYDNSGTVKIRLT